MNQQATLKQQPSCSGTCDSGGSTPATRPDYRVESRDEGVSLRLALPGVPRDQVAITLTEGLLTVTAERHETVPEDWKRLRDIPRPHAYKLAVRLHPDLDPSSVKAELTDGVLTLEIQRHEAARPRTITVN